VSRDNVVEILWGRNTEMAVDNQLALADAIAEGLPQTALERVKEALRLTDVDLAAMLGMSPKTIGRLRKNPDAPVGPIASDRLYRIATLLAQAVDVFEDEDAAREWFLSPQIGLDMRSPYDLAFTGAGAREVEDLLGRIEYGVIA
jgi:putative toxin-antitoxin system antitoxin component (TIGR02293 family)